MRPGMGRGGFPGFQGGGPGGGPRGGGRMMGGPGAAGNGKYNLTLTIMATNAFNHASYAPPSGDLASPYFGVYRSLASNFGPMGGSSNVFDRRVSFQVRLSF